jgi:hypothetical protein
VAVRGLPGKRCRRAAWVAISYIDAFAGGNIGFDEGKGFRVDPACDVVKAVVCTDRLLLSCQPIGFDVSRQWALLLVGCVADRPYIDIRRVRCRIS